MYKLIYIEHVLENNVTSDTKEPINIIVRHLYEIHRDESKRGNWSNFEIVYLGTVEGAPETKPEATKEETEVSES